MPALQGVAPAQSDEAELPEAPRDARRDKPDRRAAAAEVDGRDEPSDQRKGDEVSPFLQWLGGRPLPTGYFQKRLLCRFGWHEWAATASLRYCRACSKITRKSEDVRP